MPLNPIGQGDCENNDGGLQRRHPGPGFRHQGFIPLQPCTGSAAALKPIATFKLEEYEKAATELKFFTRSRRLQPKTQYRWRKRSFLITIYRALLLKPVNMRILSKRSMRL